MLNLIAWYHTVKVRQVNVGHNKKGEPYYTYSITSKDLERFSGQTIEIEIKEVE